VLFSVAHLRALVITKGEEGARVYARDAVPLRIDAVPAARVVDTTGCGDVFGSTFAWGLASGLPLADAGAAASRAGAFVAGLPGSRGMEGLARAVHGGRA
jgi:adenosine kinase